VLVQQRQHSPHQHHEKPVERPTHVAVGIDVGVVGKTAMSVSVGGQQVGVEVGAQVQEEVDENVGVLLVENAVRACKHVVKVARRIID